MARPMGGRLEPSAVYDPVDLTAPVGGGDPSSSPKGKADSARSTTPLGGWVQGHLLLDELSSAACLRLRRPMATRSAGRAAGRRRGSEQPRADAGPGRRASETLTTRPRLRQGTVVCCCLAGLGTAAEGQAQGGLSFPNPAGGARGSRRGPCRPARGGYLRFPSAPSGRAACRLRGGR
jgi:hypothetical protein